VSFLRAGVLDAQNLVTIPHAKLVRQLGMLGSAQFAVVERAVRLWLGLAATSSEAQPRDEPTARLSS
jgi:mRNA interferase MazF